MKFICDAMLGKLAKYLRMLGLNAEYTKNIPVLQQYKGMPDQPYFLTRALKTIQYDRIIFVKSDRVKEQLREIKEIIRPYIDPDKVMNRCIICNIELVDVEKNNVEQKVPEFVFHQYAQFRECPSCGKVYWEGSHTAGMAQLMKELMRKDDEEVNK